MKKDVELINKAMLQMIVDNSNDKCRLMTCTIYDPENNAPYQFMTTGFVGYLLPSCDCYIVPPLASVNETLARVIVIPKLTDEKIDTTAQFISQTFVGDKNLIVYKTHDPNIAIDCKLLKGFGKNFTIKCTDNKTLFAVYINGNLRGIVYGVRVKNNVK